jgi:hypothetical protein
MKKISLWAKNHKWIARITIIVSFILLNCIGIVIGFLFDELKVSIPAVLFVITVAFYFSGLILYPLKQERKRSKPGFFYVKQKSCDFILAAASFFMFIYIGNHPGILFLNNPVVNATLPGSRSLPEDSTTKPHKSISSFLTSMKDEDGKTVKWRERKKLLKAQIKSLKKANDLSKGEKIALIILSVLVATGLLFLVASASCSLSCNGADGAAALVGIGGTALVIFLFILALRAILGKRKKIKQHIRNPETNNW